jgi:hypothetical protein
VILFRITDSNFICIIGDGSTDASIQEQDMWYVRLSTGDSVNAKFIGVASTEKAILKMVTARNFSMLGISSPGENDEAARGVGGYSPPSIIFVFFKPNPEEH